MSMQKQDEKGRSSEVIRIPKRLKTLLNKIKGEYGYGRVIQLLLKDYRSEEVLKKKLTKIIINDHIDELKAWNPKKKDFYETFKFIFLSMEDLSEEDNAKVREKLKNDIVDFVIALKKGEKEPSCKKSNAKAEDTKKKDLEEEERRGNHTVTDEDSVLDNYTYIEELSEPQPGLCDKCESDEVYWVANLADGGMEKLCHDCGLPIKAYLESNGGVFQ